MPEIVGEAHRFHQIAVDMEIAAQWCAPRAHVGADGTADLRDLHRVGQPRAVEIILAGKKHLCLRLQLAKRMRMDDPIPIHLKRRAIITLSAAAQPLAVERIVEPVLHRELASNTNAPSPVTQLRNAADPVHRGI
jgi:hypothetical protein